MLETTTMNVAFAKGLETKTDPKQIMTGKLLTLSNGMFISPEEITKTNGFSPLPTAVFDGSSITSGNSLAVYNESLILNDNTYMYSYSPEQQQFVQTGLNIATSVSTQSLSGEVAPFFWPAEAVNGDGIKIVVTPSSSPINDPAGLNFTYFDTNNNSVILNAGTREAVGSGAIKNVQVIPIGTSFALAVGQSGSAELVQLTQAPTNGTITVTVYSTNGSAPVLVTANNNLYMFLYTGSAFQVNEFNSSVVPTNTYTPSMAVGGAVYGLEMQYDAINNEFILGATYAGGVIINRYDTSFNLLSTIDAITDPNVNNNDNYWPKLTFAVDGTNIAIWYDTIASTGTLNNYLTFISLLNYRTTPTPGGSAVFGIANRLYSRAFYYSKKFYVGFIYVGVISFGLVSSQSGVYVYAFDIAANNSIVARVAYDETYYLTSAVILDFGKLTSQNFVNLVSWSNTTLPYFLALQDTAITVSPNQTGVILPVFTVSDFTVDFGSKIRAIPLGKNLNLSDGAGKLFDGLGVAEQGYNSYPAVTFSNISPTAANTFSYEYTAVYVWYDFQGNLHRSAPSIPNLAQLSAAIGAGGTVTVVTPGLGLTEQYKAPGVQVQFYRTTNAGTVFYLIGTVTNSENNIVSFTDTFTDALIIGNTQLYTTGGEVENINPPPYSLSTEFKNRQIIVNAEDPLQWWYSKQVIEGFPVEFSDLFTQNIDQKGGPITALSTMDNYLIFFKTNNVWYVIGDGPAPDGSQNDFTYPQIISSDTGCVNQDSIILTPQGLMFQSPKGIYLLGRDLSLKYIGSPVEEFNSYTVTSAQMIANTNQIRFTLNTSTVLIYDYFVGEWSTETDINAVDAVIYNSQFTYLTAAGVASVETPATYINADATPIAMSLTTGWFSFGQVQGFERIKQILLLIESPVNTTLSVTFAYDFNPAVTQTVTIPVSASSTPLQYRVFPSRQKCQSMQISINETPGAGGDLKLSGMMFTMGVKKGANKVTAAQSYG